MTTPFGRRKKKYNSHGRPIVWKPDGTVDFFPNAPREGRPFNPQRIAWTRPVLTFYGKGAIKRKLVVKPKPVEVHMPREARRDEVSRRTEHGIEFVTLNCPFNDGKDANGNPVEKTVTVEVPSTSHFWRTYLGNLTGDLLDTQYDRWVSATVTAAKAAEREAAASESTIVKRDGIDHDVLQMDKSLDPTNTRNVKLACALINAAYMESNGFGWNGVVPTENRKGSSAPQNAYIVARRKLLESKLARYSKEEGAEHERMIVNVA